MFSAFPLSPNIDPYYFNNQPQKYQTYSALTLVTQDSVTSSKYHISTTDASTSHTCTATITNYGMTSPRVANFIDERPTHVIDNKLEPLPSWTSNSISGDLTYGGVAHSIWTPYSSGYYQLDRMTTDGTSGTHELITEGTVNTSGSFTWTYHFST